MIFALLHIGDDDFHCVTRGFAGTVEYQRIKEDLFNKLNNAPITEVIRGLDEYFGKEYYTLKNLFIDKKKEIIEEIIQEQLEEFSSLYYKIYNDSQSSIMYLHELNLPIPDEFKIAAQYTLSRSFNSTINEIDDISDIDNFNEAININNEAERLKIAIDKSDSIALFTGDITSKMLDFIEQMTHDKATELINIIEVAQELKIYIDPGEAQNLYFNELNNGLSQFISNLPKSENYEKDKLFISEVLKLGEKLNFNMDKYYSLLSKNLVSKAPIRQ